MRCRGLLVAAAWVVLGGLAHATGPAGVVLLHGKAETPAQLEKLAADLTSAGYTVETPELCWSKTRIFDKTLPDCLKEVDAAVADLRAKGAGSVVVGGTAFGAIAAIDYGATHSGLAGVIAMAPAADPPDPTRYPDFAAAIKAAQAAAKGKKGTAADATSYSDLLDGRNIEVTATAAAFVSFHGSASPVGAIRTVKAKVLPKLAPPLLWISGTADPTQASTRAVFSAAPDNRLSSYVRIDADHAGTPDAAAETIIAWLKTLG